VSVASARVYFKYTFVNGQQTNSEGAPTKMENKNVLFFGGGTFVKTISDFCCLKKKTTNIGVKLKAENELTNSKAGCKSFRDHHRHKFF
jgi:hypothetical protein